MAIPPRQNWVGKRRAVWGRRLWQPLQPYPPCLSDRQPDMGLLDFSLGGQKYFKWLKLFAVFLKIA